jgi:FtsZ-binding cell division protein ZapB
MKPSSRSVKEDDVRGCQNETEQVAASNSLQKYSMTNWQINIESLIGSVNFIFEKT